jgi:hypothetical protein
MTIRVSTSSGQFLHSSGPIAAARPLGRGHMASYADDNAVHVAEAPSSCRPSRIPRWRPRDADSGGRTSTHGLYADDRVAPMTLEVRWCTLCRRSYVDGGRRHCITLTVSRLVPTTKAIGVSPESCSGISPESCSGIQIVKREMLIVVHLEYKFNISH